MRKLVLFAFLSVIISGLVLVSPASFSLAQNSTAFATPDQSVQSYSDDFSSDSGAWQYLGSAYRDRTDQHLVLTTSANDQTGVAFFRTPNQDAFTVSFNYKGTGDGFLFFFYKQNYPSTIDWEESYGDNGVAGGRLGFNTQSIIPGYGVEFDGWANIASEFDDIVGGKPNPSSDPSNSHIALIKDFTGNHLDYVNNQRIYDNEWHDVCIEVQGSSVDVYFDRELVIQWSGVLNRTYGGLGFSGSNGMVEASWHIIDDFSINARNLQKPSLALSCKSSSAYSSFNVQIDGSLTLDGKVVSDVPILLSYSINGGKSWQDLTMVNTLSDGTYSAIWTPLVTGIYMIKAVYEGGIDSLPASATVNYSVTQDKERNVFSVNSNSTVSSLAFNSTSRTLSFSVSGPSGTTGYADVSFSKTLVPNIEEIKVLVDLNQLEHSVTATEDSWQVHFQYQHSTHNIIVDLGTNQQVAGELLENWIYYGAVIAGLAIVIITIFVWKQKRGKNETYSKGV
ncbi:MAG: hypothetical protein NWF02_02035 [Candidatus Bathyarchaeota archaeon]|nr:hypothetical protein [Candidatus Bathyarchaeum sp.]